MGGLEGGESERRERFVLSHTASCIRLVALSLYCNIRVG